MANRDTRRARKRREQRLEAKRVDRYGPAISMEIETEIEIETGHDDDTADNPGDRQRNLFNRT